jgi:hypothetical protein
MQANALKTLTKKTINKKWQFPMNLNGSARFLFGEEGENEQQIAGPLPTFIRYDS